MQGQVLLKGGWKGGWHFSYLIFIFEGLSFLHLKITLPFTKLCYAFEGKLSWLKMNLKVSHKLRYPI